jgi:lipoprotein-anchoring transpeptidase ErfK/SrfK
MTSAGRRLSLAAIAAASVGCATVLLASPAQAAATPCATNVRACVDLSTQQAWLTHGGVVDYGPVTVKTGRASAPTDPGTFHVSYKDIDHVSSIYDVPMPYAVFFNGGDAFHEGSLSESSHGCVHLSQANASRFYSTLQVGDLVEVVR